MRVVATKPAFHAGCYVRVGEELELPEATPGSWFAPVGTPAAERALRDSEPPRPTGWRTPHTEMRAPEHKVTYWNPYEGM